RVPGSLQSHGRGATTATRLLADADFQIRGISEGIGRHDGRGAYVLPLCVSWASLDSAYGLHFGDHDADQRARAYLVHDFGTHGQFCPVSASSAGILFFSSLADRFYLYPGSVAAHAERLELRPPDISEHCFLPLVGGEIPVAGSGFVVVSAWAVGDGRGAPIVHAHLQQGSGRNFDAGFDGAAFEVSGW